MPPHARALDRAGLRRQPLPALERDTDKEARGHVLVAGGSRLTPGAALLAAHAALRGGAGKLTMAVPAAVALPLALHMPEAKVVALPETRAGRLASGAISSLEPLFERFSGAVLGPGMPEDGGTGAFTRAVLRALREIPVVLDAAAMHCLPGHKAFGQPLLITPHAGEMAALLGRSKEEIQARPAQAALEAARRWNLAVALKGGTSWIAGPAGELWRHVGNLPGLATSGSGDVLAGLAAGLAARGASCLQAACWAVLAHARAGHALERRYGIAGYLARELTGEIPAAISALEGRALKRRPVSR